MKRKLILSLAMSLDGYIAASDDSYDWIVGDGDTTLDTPNKWDFQEFMEGIDTVIMGKRCYDLHMHQDFAEKKVYVATSSPQEDYDNIHFVNKDIVSVIAMEKEMPGKNLFLFGGGLLAHDFIRSNAIDEYIIGIIPTILGNGIPFFHPNDTRLDLHLKEYSFDSGIAVLHYVRRN